MSPRQPGFPTEPGVGLDGAVLQLTVGAVAHGGHCVARDQGRVVFVRHALPGETVRALVTEERKGFLRADAIEVLVPSAHRVAAPCPFAGPDRCGGCDFQHADLEYQRALKADVLREQLTRIGGVDVADPVLLNVTVRALPRVPGEPDGQGWRTRVQYTVDSTGRAGLLKHRSHEVVPIDRCLIAHARVRDCDVLERRWDDLDGVAVVAGIEADPTILGRRGRETESRIKGPDQVRERAVGRDWVLPAQAFWQVHPAAADALAATVVELLQPRAGDRIWDLYGGVGLFAAALAQSGASQRGTSEERTDRAGRDTAPSGRVTVVEGSQVAAAAAAENLRDLSAVTVVRADVARALVRPHDHGRRRSNFPPLATGRADDWRAAVDVVVMDPPRAGAGTAVVNAVAMRAPRAVAYVACDPAALARDVRTFHESGYRLTELRAYDLFPHTHHVECVALLTRRRGP